MAEASLLIKQREMNLIKNKYLFAGIVTLFAFFSCQKEELQGNSSDSIRFNVKVAEIKNAATRSTLHTGNTLTTGSFGVFGYCVPYVAGTQNEDLTGASKSWDEKKDNCHPDVLYAQKVDISNGSTTYEYKHPEGDVIGGAAPWVTTYANGSDPATYTYSFFAYYPFEDGVWTVTPQTQLGTPQFAFSMPFNSTNTNTSLADANIKDVMVAATYDRTCFDGAVPLNFNHVLTGINVRAQHATNSNYSNIYITSVTLYGTFNKKVTIDFDGDPPTVSDNYKGTFTFYSKNSGQILPKGSTINIGDGKTILLLPHYEYGLGVDENNDVTLSVSYKTRNSNRAPTTTKDISLKGFRPVAGTNYTLNLLFASSAIQLSVTPGENWEDGGDSSSTIK